MNDDAIYDLVRESLKDLASEARTADVMTATVRRMRRRTLSMSIGALCAAAALLIGVPVVVAAAAGPRGDGSPSVTQSASVPARHTAEPALSMTARSEAAHTSASRTGPAPADPSPTDPAGWSPAARRS